MTPQSALAIYDDREKAKQAIAALLKAGVTTQCISVISREEQLPPLPPEEQEDLAEDVSIGAAVGATVGALTGGVALLATGVGTVAVVGALVALLGGAASGSLVGLLAGYSVAEEQARDYEHLIETGHVLVFVSGDPLQVAQAQTIFEETPPHILHLHAAAAEAMQ